MKTGRHPSQMEKIEVFLARQNSPICERDIVEQMEIPRGTIYQALKRLRDAGKLQCIIRFDRKYIRKYYKWVGGENDTY